MSHQGQFAFNAIADADVLSRTSNFQPVAPPRRIVRQICAETNNRLRDEAKEDRAAGRETKAQKVHRCLAAFENRYQYWPTAAELTRYMFEHGEIPQDRTQLVAPRLSIGVNGDLHKDGTRTGGGLYELLPKRLCRINGDQAHPYRVKGR